MERLKKVNFSDFFEFLGEFSSSNPCDEDFRGSTPFSEMEVISLAKFLHSINGTLKAYIDLHSYGKNFVYPYAFSRSVKAAEAQKMVFFNGS